MPEIIPRQGQDLLVLNEPELMTTCEPYTFSWSSAVDDAALTLTLYWVEDGIVSPSPSVSNPLPTFSNTDGFPPVRKRAPPDVPDRVVSVRSWSLSMQTQTFEWSSVDVPEGVYLLYGSVNSRSLLDDTTRPFSIYNGTDVSCLIANPSASNSGSTPSPTSIMTSASSAPPVIPTVTPPAVPVGGSSSSVNIGAIVGGVVGGIGLVVAAVLAYFFFIVRRRRRQINDNKRNPPSIKSAKRGTGKGGEGIGNWKGLGSVDMHDPEGNTGGYINGRSFSTESATKEFGGAASDETGTTLVYPSVMTPAPVNVDRRASLTGTKKTARKPVPSYLEPASAPSPPPIHSGTPSPTFDPDYPGAITERKYSASSSTSAAHERGRSGSNPKRELKHTYADSPKDPDEEVAEAMVRGLKTKASFGDMMQMKPVHYLMPDMPLEERR